MSTREDLTACTQLMRGGSKSFFAASRLLPRDVRVPATALYAFCRLADDAIDLSVDQSSAVCALQNRLAAIYDAQPHNHQADRALAEVVRVYDLPQPLLAALLEGFAWDAQHRQYETLDQLHDYAARVAGTVGAMMAVIMGARNAACFARACELGVAMQLTNIARDVGEDARAGRLYLPREWLRQEGLDPDEWLEQPRFHPAVARATGRLLTHADMLYAKADQGLAGLPRRCRPAIYAARLVYADIGRCIRALACDSVSNRAVVSTRRKLALLQRASFSFAVLPSTPRNATQVLPAVQFLVDAAINRERSAHANRSFYERTLWVIDLFERLAHQNQAVHWTS
jgi:15-cis-phytoene synthase